jgi:hypothetical protein
VKVLIKWISIFIPALLISCSTQISPTDIIPSYTVSEINKLCAVSIAYDGCTGLDQNYYVIRGRLFTDVTNHPTVFPINTEIDDFESENEPKGITLLVNRIEAAKITEFNGKLVTVSGKLSTQCVLQYRDVKARENTRNATRANEDEIFIFMLTGTCHYVSRYITDPKVEAISKHEEKQK